MIIQSLEVQNLFSYRGSVRFELAPRDPNRPIVVIRARNGQGKTNLLNALKLALGGVTETLRMDAAKVGSTVPHTGYVWGSLPHRWEGIIHRQVRRSPGNSPFSVTVTLQDGSSLVRVQRAWTAEPPSVRAGGYAGSLDVRLNGGLPLDQDKAEEVIHQLIPADLLPYFIFDGELVQRLGAFDDKSLKNDAYHLMELHLIERLSGELGACAAEWVRESEIGEVHLRVVKLENTIRDCEARQLVIKEQQARMRSEFTRLDAELREVERLLRQFDLAGPDERGRIAGESAAADERFKSLRAELWEKVLPLSPLLFNEPRVERAQERLEATAVSAHADDVFHGARIKLNGVPTKIVEDPRLASLLTTNKLRSTLMDVCAEHLNNVLPPAPTASPDAWPSLSAPDAKRALTLLRAHGGAGARRGAEDSLSALEQAHRASVQLKERLANTVDLSVEQRAERQRLQGELARLSAARERARGGVETLDKELLSVGQERGRAVAELDVAMAERARRQGAQSKAGLAQRAADFTRGLLQLAASRRRAEVNRLINQRFAALFSSSAQIGRLELDGEMKLRLYTPDGRVLESYNLSAGMRQLVAVALLWALQGVSGREMPVVIDTPLARLDREHQERVLFGYLPHASRQVILLPTDAELSEERLARLAPSISHGYTLHNQSGEGTSVETLKIPGAP